MNQGAGAVFARVFNATGTIVLDKVTRLSYNHSDNAEDYSSITIETEDLTLPDHPDLQEHKKIVLVWGYMGGKTRTQRIYIWDVKVAYDSNSALRMEIIGYPKAAYLKLNARKKVYNNQSLADIMGGIAEENGLNYKEEGFSLENSEKKDSEGLSAVTFGGAQVSLLNLKEQRITVARDNTAYNRYSFRKYEAGIVQDGSSDSKLLKKLAVNEPTDNVTIEAHDDDLILRKRNLRQKPYKSYIFKAEPGYLLSFSPGSKHSETQKEAVSNSVQGWVEQDKEFVEGEIDTTHSGSPVMGDLVELTAESILRKKIYKDIESPLDQRKSVSGLLYENYEGQDGNGNPFKRLTKSDKLDTTKAAWLHITKRGTRPSQLDLTNRQVSSALDATGRIETRGVVIINPQEVITSIEDAKEQIAGNGINRQSHKELELYSATAEILGDTELESSKIIYISGIALKYTGNYYIQSVNHEVVPDRGYICYLNLLRNALTKNGNEVGNKVDASAVDIDKNTQVAIPDDGTRELFQISKIKD